MNIQGLIEVDRLLLSFFNGSDSLFLDGVMVTLTSSLTWIPLYLSLFYLVIKNNETMGQIFLVVACTLLCIFLATGMAESVVKPFVTRLRPSNDPDIKYSIDIVDNMRETGYSFFSAHAANTFAIATFFSCLVRSRSLNIALFLWAFTNGFTRIYLGVHYPSDVLVGTLWGIICDLVAYTSYHYIYFRSNPHVDYVSGQFTSTGYNRSDVDVVVAVLTLLMICACIAGTFVHL